MKAIRAVYGNGIFRPLEPVDLPEGSLVEFAPQFVEPASARPIDGSASTGKMPMLEEPSTGRMPMLPEGWKPVLQEFDPAAEFEVRWRNLPHWRQEGATYFVTFRLGDSLPQSVLQGLRAERTAWLRRHPRPVSPADLRAYQELFSEKIEAYLAAGYGACWLRRVDAADIFEGSLRFFDGDRYALDRYVVMPNHVHALVCPRPGHELSDILHSWKSYSSNMINCLVGRRGTLWQQESFDHIVRNEEESQAYRHYFEENPLRGGLQPGEYRLGCCAGIALSAR